MEIEPKVCPNKESVEWKVLMHNLDNNETDAMEAWENNKKEIPTGTKLLQYKGYYEQARMLRNMPVEGIAKHIVESTKEAFSSQLYKGSYWVKAGTTVRERAYAKVTKVNKQLGKNLFILEKVPKYHKGSTTEITILKTTDGRSVFKSTPRSLYQESGKLATISNKRITDLQNTIEYKILNEKDDSIDKKVGQSYTFLSPQDASRFVSIIEKTKKFPSN